MKPSQEILNELKSISPGLIQNDRKNVFSIPDTYFESFARRVLLKIGTLKTTLQAPQGYFSTFSNKLLLKIEELEETGKGSDNIGSLLSGLKNKNVFTVPDGYFEKNKIDLLRGKSRTAVIRPMFHKRGIWKQAVAAVVTGIISINALWMFNQSNSSITSISEDPGVSSYIRASKEYKSEEQLNEGISKLSNDDIIKYLSTNGSDADNENLISSLGEKDLPAQSTPSSDESENSADLNSTK